ncbi:DoxX family membrane protein [Rhizobium leguminosarum bv. viciae]|uniref:DoxX family protein n=1 Tax=Rhizobium leguminosarum TaxID=384 RepID=A0A7M3DJH0_RHILE|nr:DoxX family membrane protein [Rhizobium leguminosarum bv. viciae]TAY42387.1 DoxX family protein [Rhizobium leguminosarum]TBZ41329.1 DoxX family protein [Rhizobium leguminosarum bv. viciae]TCA09414.1 DoxX family protein [Rhizobium leguminosarum bv. viciae]TCA18875.1 DoxX family protein [Rhizobium leguminosarum bv. viciae]
MGVQQLPPGPGLPHYPSLNAIGWLPFRSPRGVPPERCLGNAFHLKENILQHLISNPVVGVWAPRALSVQRFAAGLVFFPHGTQKLFNFPPREGGAVELFSFMGFAGTLKVIGGALIMLGLFTRPTAFILSGMMAVAYFMAHFPRNFYPTLNGGDAAILFCFVFFYISTTGGGPWALDTARSAKTVAAN